MQKFRDFAFSPIFQTAKLLPKSEKTQLTPSYHERKNVLDVLLVKHDLIKIKLAKLLKDKTRQANPTITVIGSDERSKTRFMPTETLR